MTRRVHQLLSGRLHEANRAGATQQLSSKLHRRVEQGNEKVERQNKMEIAPRNGQLFQGQGKGELARSFECWPPPDSAVNDVTPRAKPLNSFRDNDAR